MQLEREMRQVLLQLELVSQGTTQAWDSEGGHAPPASRPPVGVDWKDRPVNHDARPAAMYARQYAACTTEGCRRLVFNEASQALDVARRACRPGNEPPKDSIYWREEVANDPRGATEVARHYMISRRTVYDLRAKYRRGEAAA